MHEVSCCGIPLRFRTTDDKPPKKRGPGEGRIPKTFWQQLLQHYPWMQDAPTHRRYSARPDSLEKKRRQADRPVESPTSSSHEDTSSSSDDDASEHDRSDEEVPELIPEETARHEARLAAHIELSGNGRRKMLMIFMSPSQEANG